MHYYIVIGPIDGFYHVGYFVPLTKVYQSCHTTRGIGIATLIAEEANQEMARHIDQNPVPSPKA